MCKKKSFKAAATIAFCTLSILSMAVFAKAGQNILTEFRLGVLDHDADNLWSGFSREGGTDFNGELIFAPHVELWGGKLRPRLGVSVNDSGNTSKVYGGGLWEYTWLNGLFVDLGLGMAIHDGEKESAEPDVKELGRNLLFHFSLDIGYTFATHHRIALMIDHMSNAYTVDPNEGMDTIGLRYGYLF